MYSQTLSVEIFFIYHFNNFHHLLALQITALLLSTGNCRCNEYELAAKRRLQVLSQPISETIEEKVREVEVSCHGSHVKVVSTEINTNCTLPQIMGAHGISCVLQNRILSQGNGFKIQFKTQKNTYHKDWVALCSTMWNKYCSHILIHEMFCMLGKFLLCGV